MTPNFVVRGTPGDWSLGGTKTRTKKLQKVAAAPMPALRPQSWEPARGSVPGRGVCSQPQARGQHRTPADRGIEKGTHPAGTEEARPTRMSLRAGLGGTEPPEVVSILPM